MTILFTIGWQSIALPCFHIRTSAALRLFAAPRSFSQLITSFFGSWCQGILHVLFFAWPFSLALFNNDLSFSLAILNYVSKLFRFCCFSVTLLHILYARVLSEKTWFFLTLLFIQFSNIFQPFCDGWKVDSKEVFKQYLYCIDHRITWLSSETLKLSLLLLIFNVTLLFQPFRSSQFECSLYFSNCAAYIDTQAV